MPRKKKLYLVQRLAWRPTLNRDFGRGMCEQHQSPEGVPIRAFESKARAAKYAKQLTAEARRELNPFQFTYQEVGAIMEGEEEDLLVAVAKLDFPEPLRKVSRWNSEYIDWPRWYDDLAETLTDAERDAIWNLLDRLELYRVVEIEFF